MITDIMSRAQNPEIPKIVVEILGLDKHSKEAYKFVNRETIASLWDRVDVITNVTAAARRPIAKVRIIISLKI